eukprot:scaffold246590_cov28-Tisochrysis_lutea.AAC.1
MSRGGHTWVSALLFTGFRLRPRHATVYDVTSSASCYFVPHASTVANVAHRLVRKRNHFNYRLAACLAEYSTLPTYVMLE